MTTSGVYIGVDGGGSKTLTLLVDSEGNELAKALTPSSNQNSVGAEAACNSIVEAVKTVLAQSKKSPDDVKGICLGLAGVDRDEDKVLVRGWVHQVLPHLAESAVHVVSDAVAGLAAGTGGELHGVVVISGTGSIALACRPGAPTVRAGGWGAMIGDMGSGHWIGTEVMRAVARAKDGMDPPTKLTELFAEFSNGKTLLQWAYQGGAEWKKIAGLAPLLFKACSAGDPAALAIAERAADHLVEACTHVARKQGFENEPFTTVLVGGILTHDGSLVARLVEAKMKETFPQCTVSLPKMSPERAAAMIAVKQCN